MLSLNTAFKTERGRLKPLESLTADKKGIRSYNAFIGFILSIFCKATKMQAKNENGKVVIWFINKKSLLHWHNRTIFELAFLENQQADIDAFRQRILTIYGNEFLKNYSRSPLIPLKTGSPDPQESIGFTKQFQARATVNGQVNYLFLDDQVVKLNEYLSTHCSEADLIYICASPGDSHHQIFPGFLIDAIMDDKQVELVLFETKDSKINITPFQHLLDIARKKGILEKDLLKKLPLITVQQFLCGLPLITGAIRNVSSSDDVRTMIYQWPSQEQQLQAYYLFGPFVERHLEVKKKVVMGYHTGNLQSEEDIQLQTYLSLIETYPQNLSLLWGWENKNLLTNRKITSTAEEQMSSDWIYYPNLFDCKLP